MPNQKTISFRSQTVGNISDFIGDEGLTCQASQNVLSYLASALLTYREEGVFLTPNVLFCTDVAEVLKTFPGAVKYKIGRAPLSHGSAKRILKDCAPLTTANWSIFIERKTTEEVEYGIFRYTRTPTSLPLDDAVPLSSASCCMLIRKTSGSTVELLGSKGNILTLVFSTVRETEPLSVAIKEFASDCCGSIDGPHATKFSPYFARLLADTLVRSHGSILACTTSNEISHIPQLSDHVPLAPPVDFYEAFAEYIDANTGDSVLALQSCEELLQGFTNSDGIVVITTRAKAIAYRCFYRATGSQQQNLANASQGGARMRAFEGSKSLLGTTLHSLLFRSQDGLTLHSRTQS